MNSLPEFDALVKMSDDELDVLLSQEVNRIIDASPPERQARLRAIHNGSRLRAQAAGGKREAMLATFKLMYKKIAELRELLVKL